MLIDRAGDSHCYGACHDVGYPSACDRCTCACGPTSGSDCCIALMKTLHMLWSSMGGRIVYMSAMSVSCASEATEHRQTSYIPSHLLRSTSVDMGWVRHAHRLDGPPDRGMLNILSGMIVIYLKCARCVCVCTCVHVCVSENPWRVASARMVEGHGVEARSNQPYAQDPGMSLCDPMYGPHVLVCVRARGVFQKNKTKKSLRV